MTNTQIGASQEMSRKIISFEMYFQILSQVRVLFFADESFFGVFFLADESVGPIVKDGFAPAWVCGTLCGTGATVCSVECGGRCMVQVLTSENPFVFCLYLKKCPTQNWVVEAISSVNPFVFVFAQL